MLTATGADEAVLGPLRERITALRRQIETDGGAFVAGNVTMQGGDFVNRDKTIDGDEVHGDKIVNVTAESPPDDLLAVYYRCVAEECSRLPLAAIDKEFVYGQVIKYRRRYRTVAVERRLCGAAEQYRARLQTAGLSGRINTAFSERVNLTIRLCVSKLTRRTWGPGKGHARADGAPGVMAQLLSFGATP